MMKDTLFWFDVLKEEGKRDYLEQRRTELKDYITRLPARDNLNDNVPVIEMELKHLVIARMKVYYRST